MRLRTISEKLNDDYILLLIDEEDNEHLEEYDIDEYEVEEYLRVTAKSEGVTILSDKKLSSILVKKSDNVVVGGLWTGSTNTDFSFDMVIDKEYQNLGLSKMLIEEAISLFQQDKEAYGDDYKIKVDVINPKLAKILKDKYNFFELTRVNDTRVIMSADL